jgi:hypothetical protein
LFGPISVIPGTPVFKNRKDLAKIQAIAGYLNMSA